MSPSRSTFLPQPSHAAIDLVIGIGGNSPFARARVAAGPQKLPE